MRALFVSFLNIKLQYVLGYQTGDRSAITNDLASMISLVYSVYGPLCNGGTAVLFDERFRAANSGFSQLVNYMYLLKFALITVRLVLGNGISSKSFSVPDHFGFC